MYREKVIVGLEICTANPPTCRGCPYYDSCKIDAQKLKEDALTLLKEQETTFEKDGHHIRCTNCGNYWCDTDREGNLFPHNYCPECGRAVKWDD